jgi:hypothetical protein
MKKSRHIFIFNSLFAMVLTIFQYIFVLEKENGNHETEVCKKSDTANDTSEDDATGDDDSNEGTDKQFSETFNFYHFHKLISSHAFYIKSNVYKCPDLGVSTPPPKV